MVLNLRIVNCLPIYPTLVCLKNTGLPSTNNIRIDIKNIIGKKNNRKEIEIKISIILKI